MAFSIFSSASQIVSPSLIQPDKDGTYTAWPPSLLASRRISYSIITTTLFIRIFSCKYTPSQSTAPFTPPLPQKERLLATSLFLLCSRRLPVKRQQGYRPENCPLRFSL